MRRTKAPGSRQALTRVAASALIAGSVALGTPVAANAQINDVITETGQDRNNAISGAIEQNGQPLDTERLDAIADDLQQFADDGQMTDNVRDILNGFNNSTTTPDQAKLNYLAEKIGTDQLVKLLDNRQISDMGVNQAKNIIDTLATASQQLIDEQNSGNDTSFENVLGRILAGGSGLSLAGAESAHSYSDLLASVIFSTSGDGKNASASQLQMPVLAQYPSNQDEIQKYGELRSPSGDSTTDAGQQTASYIEGLFNYQWIIPVEDDQETADQLGSVGGMMVTAGTLGARVYDAVTNVISTLAKTMTNLNLVNLFGLGSGENGDENVLTRWFKGLTEDIGLNSSFRAIRVTLFMTILSFLILALFMAFKTPTTAMQSMKSGRMRNLSSRILVIMLSVPFAIALTSAVDSITPLESKNTFNKAAAINSQYVMDSLAWAAATNLGFEQAGGGAETYSPDKNSVSDMMTQSYRRLGTTSDDAQKYITENVSAVDMMEALRSGQKVNVNDYLNLAMNAQTSGAVSTVAAANSPLTTPGGSISAKGFFDQTGFGDGGGATKFQPYFLTTRTNAGADGGSTSSGSTTTTEPNTDDQDESQDTGSTGTNSGEVSQQIAFDTSNGGQVKFECASGAMSCELAQVNRPSTYLYGAAPGLNISSEQSDYSNYIASKTTHQNFDPGTGEQASSEEKKKILNANAINIAVANRYSGIDNSLGANSLSTQSVMFLLQSSFKDGTLNYRAVNTGATAAGSSVNGENSRGFGFARYTIPNMGPDDLAKKVTTLMTMWLIASIIAIVAVLALLRSPLLSAVYNMTRGFLAALFMGDIGGLMKYTAYYTALRLSFYFAIAAITSGVAFANGLNSLLPTSDAIAGIQGTNLQDKNGDGEVGRLENLDKFSQAADAVTGTLAGWLQAAAIALLSMLLAAAVCIPLFTVTTGNGKVKKVSFVGLIISIPYLIADAFSSWVDNHVRTMYGQKAVNTKGTVSGARMRDANDYKQSAKNKVGTMAAVGAMAGSLATGGLSGAAMAGAKGAGMAGKGLAAGRGLVKGYIGAKNGKTGDPDALDNSTINSPKDGADVNGSTAVVANGADVNGSTAVGTDGSTLLNGADDVSTTGTGAAYGANAIDDDSIVNDDKQGEVSDGHTVGTADGTKSGSGTSTVVNQSGTATGVPLGNGRPALGSKLWTPGSGVSATEAMGAAAVGGLAGGLGGNIGDGKIQNLTVENLKAGQQRSEKSEVRDQRLGKLAADTANVANQKSDMISADNLTSGQVNADKSNAREASESITRDAKHSNRVVTSLPSDAKSDGSGYTTALAAASASGAAAGAKIAEQGLRRWAGDKIKSGAKTTVNMSRDAVKSMRDGVTESMSKAHQRHQYYMPKNKDDMKQFGQDMTRIMTGMARQNADGGRALRDAVVNAHKNMVHTRVPEELRSRKYSMAYGNSDLGSSSRRMYHNSNEAAESLSRGRGANMDVLSRLDSIEDAISRRGFGE